MNQVAIILGLLVTCVIFAYIIQIYWNDTNKRKKTQKKSELEKSQTESESN